jgi:hypothetical protein
VIRCANRRYPRGDRRRLRPHIVKDRDANSEE